MRPTRWHTIHAADGVTIARRLPVRFDVAAETVLPGTRALRLAHLIRQDIWRVLRSLRGFSPVVSVRRLAIGLAVKAGGAVDGVFPRARTEQVIAALLADPVKRARWARGAV